MPTSPQSAPTNPVPPSSGTPGVAVPAVSPPTPPARRGRRNIAVLAIVVVGVIVAGLMLTGIIPILPSSSTSSAATPTSYSSAESSANPISDTVSGGPWSLLLAEGLDLTTSYSNSTPPSGCTIAGGSGMISYGAYDGNYSSGLLSDWLFVYLNSDRTSELAVEVSGGHASEVGVLQGPSCTADLNADKVLSANLLDSTQVASALFGNSEVDQFLHTIPRRTLSTSCSVAPWPGLSVRSGT